MGPWWGEEEKNPKSKKGKTSSPKKAPTKQVSGKASAKSTSKSRSKNQSTGISFGIFGKKPPEEKPKGMLSWFGFTETKPVEVKPRWFSSIRSSKKEKKRQGIAVGSSGRGKKPPSSKQTQPTAKKSRPREKEDCLMTIGRWLHLPESFVEKRSNSVVMNGTWNMDRYERFLRDYVIVSLLFFLNTMCYTDNIILLGASKYIMKYFELEGGTLLHYCEATFIAVSLLFGILGDRLNRKWLISIGLTIWTFNNICSSLVGESFYLLFIILRLIACAGESSLRILTNPVIADLFIRPERLKFYTVFYLAVPIGTGIGYIFSVILFEGGDRWHWGLRFAHPFAIFCLLLLFVIMYEPTRGSSDGAAKVPPSKILRDVGYLITHKTFLHMTVACSCSSFVTSVILVQGPDFITDFMEDEENIEDVIGLLFGVVTIFSGITGLLGAYLLAIKLRKKSQKSDPLICGTGLMLSAPFLLLFFSFSGSDWGWIFLFFSLSLLNMPLALEVDMLMYSVIPNKRSLAGGLHYFIYRTLGEAVGNKILQTIRTKLYQEFKDEKLQRENDHLSRRFSLYATCVFVVLGGAFFFFASATIENDVAATQRNIKGLATSSSNRQQSNSIGDSSDRGRLEIGI